MNGIEFHFVTIFAGNDDGEAEGFVRAAVRHKDEQDLNEAIEGNREGQDSSVVKEDFTIPGVEL